MYACMYVCMYVSMYVCMYMHIYIYTHTLDMYAGMCTRCMCMYYLLARCTVDGTARQYSAV